MSYSLAVPIVVQTSTETCWHASAMMIWYYWQGATGRQGPMNTLADKWSANRPVVVSDFVLLAEKAGLKAVIPRPGNYDSRTLEKLLRMYGPLWCAGHWFGPGHIIVLTAVNDSTVFFNDPADGLRKNRSIEWFNAKLNKELPGCLMYKDPMAY